VAVPSRRYRQWRGGGVGKVKEVFGMRRRTHGWWSKRAVWAGRTRQQLIPVVAATGAVQVLQACATCFRMSQL